MQLHKEKVLLRAWVAWWGLLQCSLLGLISLRDRRQQQTNSHLRETSQGSQADLPAIFTGAVSVAQMAMPCSQISLCCEKCSGHALQNNFLYATLLNLPAPRQVHQCAGELCSWRFQIGCSHSASAYHPSPTSAKRHIHPSAEQHANAQQDLIALHYTTAQMRR